MHNEIGDKQETSRLEKERAHLVEVRLDKVGLRESTNEQLADL